MEEQEYSDVEEEDLTEETMEEQEYSDVEEEDLTEETMEEQEYSDVEEEDLTEEMLEEQEYSDVEEGNLTEEMMEGKEGVSYCQDDNSKKEEKNWIISVRRNIPKVANQNKKTEEKKKNGISDAWELSSYEFALHMIKQHQMTCLARDEKILWYFDGKSYAPLSRAKLEDLIYQKISEDEKHTVDTCSMRIRYVADYIRRECRAAYDSEKKVCHCFELDDAKKINGKVVLNNGIYDVIHDKFMPFWDENLPFYYHINADFVKYGETPFFDKILSDATEGDEESIKMIQYVLGMLLLPNKCKKFPVVGPASNSGKSVLFGQFLDRLFDSSRILRVSSSELGGKFALGEASDKLLISCLDMDVDEIPPRAAGVIKRATGEEKINVQAKYVQNEDIIVRFHFLFGTNGSFSPKKFDSGWVNRIIAVPFIHETPEEEQIANLLEHLLEEKDAIVSKVLRMMRDVVKPDGSIVIPESRLSIDLKNQWTLCYTFFNEFCEKCVSFTGNKEDMCSKEAVYTSYSRFFDRSVAKAKNTAKFQKLSQSQFLTKFSQEKEYLIWDRRVRKEGDIYHKNPVRRIAGIKLLI